MASNEQPGEHVFRFDLYNAQGKRNFDGGANVVAENGSATWTPDGELPKGGQVVCRDVATGIEGIAFNG